MCGLGDWGEAGRIEGWTSELGREMEMWKVAHVSRYDIALTVKLGHDTI